MQFNDNDPDSTLILTFTPVGAEGRIDLVHLDVPIHDHQGVTEGWTHLLDPVASISRAWLSLALVLSICPRWLIALDQCVRRRNAAVFQTWSFENLLYSPTKVYLDSSCRRCDIGPRHVHRPRNRLFNRSGVFPRRVRCDPRMDAIEFVL